MAKSKMIAHPKFGREMESEGQKLRKIDWYRSYSIPYWSLRP